mgnify:CR=1 FL=1
MTESNEDILTGSVRSVKNYDVYQSLSDCKDNIIQYGGHKYAAGLKIRKSKFNNFKNQFEDIVKDSVGQTMFKRSFSYDLLIDFSKLTIENIKIIKRMSPFGLGNKRPVFRTNNCFINRKLKRSIMELICARAPSYKRPFFKHFYSTFPTIYPFHIRCVS